MVSKLVQFPVKVEKGLVKSIDLIVKLNPEFSSRSDYVRKRLLKSVEEDKRRLLDETALEIKGLLVERGVKPGLLTKKKKRRIAEEFLKKKGLK